MCSIGADHTRPEKVRLCQQSQGAGIASALIVMLETHTLEEVARVVSNMAMLLVRCLGSKYS